MNYTEEQKAEILEMAKKGFIHKDFTLVTRVVRLGNYPKEEFEEEDREDDEPDL